MKIKTITCHHVYNHGAYLQAYALVTYLRMIGHEASIIDYRPKYLSQHFKLWTNSNFDRIGLGWLYNLAKMPYRIIALRRKKVFDKFYTKFMPVDGTRYNNSEELKNTPPTADAYIAGSDQIWNTSFINGTDPAFYLDFGNKETKRISYAASFATDSLKPGTEKFVKSKLSNFDHISVRESSGTKILQDLGYNGTEVMDPIFLLTTDDWNKLTPSLGLIGNYILIYDFERSNAIKTIALRLKKSFGLKIYSIGPYRLNYADRCFINRDPTSFVSLVKNAKYVISNSFHGTAFSLLYHKDFFVVKRQDGLNTRMKDFLFKFRLESRLIDINISDENLVKPINYEEISSLIENQTLQSKAFINKALISVKQRTTL